MGGPELAPAPPAVKGLAILLSAELGAKEYFGWTEAAACESYRGGWWERGRQRTATAHDMRVKTASDTRCEFSLLLHNPQRRASWHFSHWKRWTAGLQLPPRWDLMAFLPRAQTRECLRTELFFICAGGQPQSGGSNLLQLDRMKILNNKTGERNCHFWLMRLSEMISNSAS